MIKAESEEESKGESPARTASNHLDQGGSHHYNPASDRVAKNRSFERATHLAHLSAAGGDWRRRELQGGVEADLRAADFRG